MLIALDIQGNRMRATRSISGFCPECKENVIGKCGQIRAWYWAHKPDSACNYNPGDMCEWHIALQNDAADRGAEIEVPIINDAGVKRIADIVIQQRVIELQHSIISRDEILSRVFFYENMGYKNDWVIDHTQSEYIEIKPENIRIINNSKAVFDILFHLFYARVIFDFGCVPKRFFLAKDMIPPRDRYAPQYIKYSGFFMSDYLVTGLSAKQLFDF